MFLLAADNFRGKEINFNNNKCLAPEFVNNKPGSFLHRFNWIDNKLIGELDKKWNWLAIEYEEKDNVNLIHYTIGTPCFKEYNNTSFSSYWKESFSNLLDGYYKKEILK